MMKMKKKILHSRNLAYPAIFVLLIITVFPIGYSIYISMTNFHLTIPGFTFVGLDNFRELMNDAMFWTSLWNTARMGVPAVIIQMVLGFSIAVLINRKFAGRGIFIAIFVAPIMLAPGAVSLAFRLLFDPTFGPVNHLVGVVAGRPISIDWLGSPVLAPMAVIIIDVWQMTPFVMLLSLAGLSTISPELYEAAYIDGANKFQAFARITMPLVKKVLFVIALFRIVDVARMFDIPFALFRGGPGTSTMTISILTYLRGLQFMRIGNAAAISLIFLVIMVVLVLIFLKFNPKEKKA